MLLNDPTNRFKVWRWDEESDARVLQLRRQGYTYPRIAELMGIPSVDTVRKRIAKISPPIDRDEAYTAIEKEQFTRLYTEGLSMNEIAARMGRTKNAMCGLRSRLNLPKRVSVAKPGVPNPYASKISRARLRCDGRPRAPKIAKDPAELIAAQKRIEEAADVGFHNGGLTFAQLTATCCRFIKGEVQDPNHRYCGSKVVDGKSWCRHHLGVVFRHG